ncbi:uncharacterized protein LOC105910873 [Clupea harengus]|uniref:Uncharacterized protein LOC105910873 n=1 Tax=Clupea harengus TaxID=7950 RepID=A0A6P8G584_CLUHA|nr:uncharacterized protein LOC105910873 [Clupea harengus]
MIEALSPKHAINGKRQTCAAAANADIARGGASPAGKTEERGRDGRRGARRPGVERRMEEWKREVTHELSSLRGHVNRNTSLGNLEESFSSKLRREEVDQLRREVDQFKSKLMRQEEDMFQQQSEARETRRQYERSCKMLEGLTDSYRTHSFDLARTVSQYQNTQQEVRTIRVTVSELKDEVRGLILRDRLPTPAAAPSRPAFASAVAVETIPRRQAVVPSAVAAAAASDSDNDYSPTPSLGEVSSDDLDLSWPSEPEPVRRRNERRGNPAIRLPGSDISDFGSGLEDGDDDGGVFRRLSDSPPELSLSDL